jgi:hypothetical protein
MSANRANASARNRRAGGAEMSSPQQGGRGGQNQNQNQRQPGRGGQQQETTSQNPKISISDAIGLISLRLGRVETFMYTINHEGLPSSENLSLGENDRIVDDEVFRSIVSRLDALEKKIDMISSQQNNNQDFENNPLISSLLKEIKESKKDKQLEIYEIKDMILKLQTFSMETSTSLKNLCEQYESDKLFYIQENSGEQLVDNYQEQFDNVEILDENNISIDSSSLKELIKKELFEQEAEAN